VVTDGSDTLPDLDLVLTAPQKDQAGVEGQIRPAHVSD
jgi:hypothetical protein